MNKQTKHLPEATATETMVALINFDAAINEAVQLMRVNLRGNASAEQIELMQGFCELIGLNLNEGNK